MGADSPEIHPGFGRIRLGQRARHAVRLAGANWHHRFPSLRPSLDVPSLRTIAALPTPAFAAEEAPTVAELFKAHAGFVWRVLQHLGVSDADVEDASQEVF